jgi:hypothetical protein
MRSLVTLTLAASLLLLAGGASAAPGKAGLHGPSAAAAKNPIFQFSNVPSSPWYYLWINGPSGSLHTVWYEASKLACGTASCSIDPKLTLPDGHYKWWIQTWDSSGSGPWSEAMEFDVSSHGGGNMPPPVPFNAVMWIDHLAFQPGTPSVVVSFDALDSGVGAGTSGLIVEAAPGSGPREVEQGLLVPSGLLVDGVRVCYELSDRRSTISGVRIEQLDDPPDRTQALLVDGRGMPALGPICVDTAAPAQPIDASTGSLRLQLRLDFPDPTAGDRIVIRGVGLHVVNDPNGPLQGEIARINKRLKYLETTLGNHSHIYLTAKGVGHNNTNATTGGPLP